MSKPDLIRRQHAVDKTLARYRDRPFAWGKADCVQMLRGHLVAMGHRGLPALPKYKDALGAVKALREAGFDTIPALLDSLLTRIPPAFALAGDIFVTEGDGLDAVHVSLGFKAFGWHEDVPGAAVLILKETKGAWRA